MNRPIQHRIFATGSLLLGLLAQFGSTGSGLAQDIPPSPAPLLTPVATTENAAESDHAIDLNANGPLSSSPALQPPGGQTSPEAISVPRIPPSHLTQSLESEPVGLPPSLKTQPTSPDELPFKPSKVLLQRRVRYGPSITLLTPSAYGKSWGQVSVGGSFLSRVRYRSQSDAILGVGFGLGDAQKAVGLDVGIGISDVTGFQRGGISFKVHRRLADQFALAVGVNNAISWGRNLTGISPYGVATKGFQLRPDPGQPFSQLYVSAGAGTGRYRSEGDILNDRNTVGVFGSVAVRVIEPMNLIAEWSGQDLTLGVSILPFRNFPLVFSPAVTDITGTAGDGPRFTFGVGLGFTF